MTSALSVVFERNTIIVKILTKMISPAKDFIFFGKNVKYHDSKVVTINCKTKYNTS